MARSELASSPGNATRLTARRRIISMNTVTSMDEPGPSFIDMNTPI